MKQLFETDELIGKTIKGVSELYQPTIVLSFTDDSFTVFDDCRDRWESGDTEFSINEDPFDIAPNRHNYQTLYKLSMINKYVYDELHDFFTKMKDDEQKEAFLNSRREEIHKLQQLAQKYPEIATLKS